LTSRPRRHPRSCNHLLGVLRRLFDRMVNQGSLDASPIRLRPRRVTARRIPYLFDLPQACRLIEVASALPDNNRAIDRGATYTTIFALLYGLGLRVGEVARLTIADIDLVRNLLVIRGTKFGKSRFVPFGPQMAARLATYFDLRRRQLGTLPPEERGARLGAARQRGRRGSDPPPEPVRQRSAGPRSPRRDGAPGRSFRSTTSGGSPGGRKSSVWRLPRNK
jgi:integrase